MRVYRSKIIKKETIAAGTTMIEIEKPNGFDFKAGQFIKLSLPDLENNPKNTNWRWLSIASAPYEANLAFVYRESDSSFKSNLLPDAKVTISRPLGTLHLPTQDFQPIVFLAGGVGIAPSRSLVLQAEHENRLPVTWLFYSNRQIEDAAFLDEFKKIKNPKFNFIPVMSRLEPTNKNWTGETGHISIEMLKRYFTDLTKQIYLVIGSPAFTDALVTMLTDAGIASQNIRLEKFIGL